MVIKINNEAQRVEQPTITLTGVKVYDSGQVSNHIQDFTIDKNSSTTIDINTADHTEITNRSTVYLFRGDVRVTITSDPKWPRNVYGKRDSLRDIIGSTQVNKGNVNRYSETYYTLNGKDPVRTKAHLYIDDFRVRENLSGTDSTVLKVRTYIGGQASAVTTVQFKIIDEGTNPNDIYSSSSSSSRSSSSSSRSSSSSSRSSSSSSSSRSSSSSSRSSSSSSSSK